MNHIIFLDRKKNTLTVSFSLIFSQFFYFDLHNQILVSPKYILTNTLSIFIFSIFFFFTVLSILNSNFLNKYNFLTNFTKFVYLLIFTLIFFKIVQIPSFYGNFPTIKILFKNFFLFLFDNKFQFLIQFFKILFPFLIIFLLVLFFFKKNKDILINFCLSFSIIFLCIMIYSGYYKFTNINISEIKTKKPISEKKVVWFLFDGLDPWYLFNQDKHKLKLPNLTSLSKKSVVGENIYSPANSTLYSMAGIFLNAHPKDSVIIDGDINLINDGNKIKFNFENSFLYKLDNQNFSFNIVSDTLPYCVMLKIDVNCLKNYNKINTYFDGIKKLYLPTEYYIKIKTITAKREKFNLKKLNSINNSRYDSNELLLNKEFKFNMDNFRINLNKNTNLDFYHIYVPHIHGLFDNINVLTLSYIKDLLNQNPTSADEEYLMNIKYVDLIVNEISKSINQSLKEDILLIISSDHWRRGDSPKQAKPSFFLSKIKNDNESIYIPDSRNNLFIGDLIFRYLKSEIESHSDISLNIKNRELFTKDDVYFYSID